MGYWYKLLIWVWNWLVTVGFLYLLWITNKWKLPWNFETVPSVWPISYLSHQTQSIWRTWSHKLSVNHNLSKVNLDHIEHGLKQIMPRIKESKCLLNFLSFNPWWMISWNWLCIREIALQRNVFWHSCLIVIIAVNPSTLFKFLVCHTIDLNYCQEYLCDNVGNMSSKVKEYRFLQES